MIFITGTVTSLHHPMRIQETFMKCANHFFDFQNERATQEQKKADEKVLRLAEEQNVYFS